MKNLLFLLSSIVLIACSKSDEQILIDNGQKYLEYVSANDKTISSIKIQAIKKQFDLTEYSRNDYMLESIYREYKTEKEMADKLSEIDAKFGSPSKETQVQLQKAQEKLYLYKKSIEDNYENSDTIQAIGKEVLFSITATTPSGSEMNSDFLIIFTKNLKVDEEVMKAIYAF